MRIVASASIPFVFPHRVIGNWTLMDGGSVWNTNLISAVNKCMEIVGNDQSKIVMDIIILGQDRLNSTDKTSNSLGNYLRYRDIKNFNKQAADVMEFSEAYPNITYRYFFMSSKPLTSGTDEINFAPEIIQPMIQMGKDDAKTVVEQGIGKSFEKFSKWYKDHKIRNKHDSWREYVHSVDIL